MLLLFWPQTIFFCSGTSLDTFAFLNNFNSSPANLLHCPLHIYLLHYLNTSLPPSQQPWLPRPARESHPHPPPSRTSRVPLGLRVSLVPSTSVPPLVLVLRKSKTSKRAYLSPREKREFSRLRDGCPAFLC